MKKYLFGLFALAFAIGAVAFTSPSKKVKKEGKDLVVYVFTGNSSQQADATKYIKTTLPSCSGAQNVFCTITAPDNGSNPDFTISNPVSAPNDFLPWQKKPS